MKNIDEFVGKLMKGLGDAEFLGGGDIIAVSFPKLELDVQIHAYVWTGEPKHVYLENLEIINFIPQGDQEVWRDFRRELRRHIHEEVDAMMGDI